MPIHYALFENNLTSDPNDYMAYVQPVGTADHEAIIARMLQQGSTVTKADTVSVLESYFTAIENMVLEGLNVNTPIANFRASIKGIFNGQTDSYDPNRHQITAIVSPGARFRDKVAKQAQAVKQEASRPTPNLLDYLDLSSGERNSVLTSGGMGQIVGHRLQFDPTDSNQGIFFIASDGGETPVSVIGRNKPADLMFMVPALASGEYSLVVRTIFRGAMDLRRGALKVTLTVA